MIFNFSGSSNQLVTTGSATVSNTTTETTLIGTVGRGSTTIESDSLVLGRAIVVTAGGVYSTQVAPVTLRLKVKIGSVVVLDTGAQLPAGSLANRGWMLWGLITCRTTGASGTVFGQGVWNGATTALAAVQWDLENTTTSTIDTTADQTLDFTAQWAAGVAAADSITCSNLVIDLI